MANDFQYAEGRRVALVQRQQREIKKLYKEALKDIQKQINKLRFRTNVSSVLRRQYLDELSKIIKERLTEVNKQLQGNIQTNMLSAAEAVIEDNSKMLMKMGLSFATPYMYVPSDVVREVASGKLYEGRWSLSTAIWTDNQKTLKDIDFIVAKGIAENKNVYDIAKDLERYVTPGAKKPWDWSKVYPTSKKIIDYNAQRLARTMISHAYQESFVRVTKNNPFIETYRWLISNSDRVCPLCISRAEDDQFGLGAGIFPKDQLPLDHPNGMCTFESVRSKSYDQIADDLVNWVKGEGSTELNKQIDHFVEDLSERKGSIRERKQFLKKF